MLPDLGQLSASDKDALIVELWTRLQAALASVAALTAKVQALEARLGKPPKTPANSSLPPSRAEKPNKRRRRRKKRKGRPGKGRKLHPQPDETVTLRAEQCAHCGTRLAGQEQKPQAVYDRIEIPPVRPHVTRVELLGCACPQCGKPVLAAAPAALGRGSPFGESIAQLATYLHYVHAISYQRLCALFRDVFGLEISEGALANLFRRVQGRLGDAVEEIRARVRASRVVKSDKTGARVQGRKAWEWVYIGEGAVLHMVAPSRAKREPEAVLDGARPEVWVADLFGSQQAHGERGQVCLAHQSRDVQYALDAGDAVFAPAMLAWLQRAIQVGQKRERVKDVTLQRHRRDLRKRLEEILQLEPEQADGQRLRQRYAKCKEGLLVLVTDREVPFTNNESERALRPSVIFRKVTNGTRSEWGAEFFAAVRSVIGTGRLHGLSPFQAIAQTIDGRSILNPV